MPSARSHVFAVAHRGLSTEFVENTMAAFKGAAEAGFKAVELDLRTTRDHEVIVLHDDGIERTTGGNGRVADMSYDELRGYATADGPVPRLDDLLAALRHWPGLWNLEIKSLKAVEPAVHLVDHHKLNHRTQISSFDPRALGLARDHAPDVSRALIVGGSPDLDDIATAKDLGCTWMNVDRTYLSPAILADLLARGFRIGVWTVNDPNQALALAERGVSAIITDERVVFETLKQFTPPKLTF